MPDINDLIQQRTKLVADSRVVYDLIETEKRALTDEEKANDDARGTQIDDLTDQIKREERQIAREAEEARVAALPEPAAKPDGKDSANRDIPRSEMESWQVRGYESADAEKRDFNRYLGTGIMSPEQRNLSMDIESEGGFTVPDEFNTGLIAGVTDAVSIRGLAQTFSVTGGSLGFPTLTRASDPEWTAELLTGSEDTTMAFGKREFLPKPLAKRIKLSKKLLRASALGVEALVRSELARVNAEAEEKAFMTGSGSGRPLGIFTADPQGISTSRDVSTGNTTTGVTFDGLINSLYSLKGQYQGTVSLLAHRDFYKETRKLKDGNGQYIWQPGGQAGEPDRILGRPTIMSEFAPNTFTTGLYVAIWADFDAGYYIADALGTEVQALFELYAESNQVGFISRREVDGMPVLEEAFARVTLA